MMQPRRPVLAIGLLSAGMLLLAGWLAGSIMFGGASRSGEARRLEADEALDSASAEGASSAGPAAEPGAPMPAARVDFSGRWELDLKASDSLDAVLKACGINIVERMILDNAPITQEVRQSPDEITIDITSGPYHRTDVMWLDGRKTKAEDPAGRPVISVSVWNQDGTAVITKVWQESQTDMPPWQMTRMLSEDGNTTYVINEYVPPQGERLTSRRIYHRVGDEPGKTP